MSKSTILFLSANPEGTGPIELDQEARSLQIALSQQRRVRFKLETRWAAQAQDLLHELQVLRPTIVHFSGHGRPGTPNDRDVALSDAPNPPVLCFVGQDGSAHWVDADTIANTLRQAGASVKLVVLNACHTAELGQSLLRHVPRVVAMAGPIDDRSARSFATEFYGRLCRGEDAEQACTHAKLTLRLKNLPDWDAPTYLERGGGEPIPPYPRPARHLTTGIRTALVDGHGTYLLAMLAFGAAATFVHRTVLPEWKHHRALADLLTRVQEPYRAETHPVIASALLSNAAWDLCQNVDLLHKTDEATQRFEIALSAALTNGAPAGTLSPCSDPAICPRKTAGVGPALTDDAKDSILIVPSTVAPLVLQEPRAKAILIASSVIASASDRLIDGTFGGATVNNAYFVDLAGAIRIIPRSLRRETLPAHRTFAGSSYMYSTLSQQTECSRHGRPRSITQHYLDLAGAGVVKTLCHRMLVSEPGAWPAPGVVGVLCFDISRDEPAVYDALDEAATLFDLHVVHLYDSKKFENIPGLPDRLSRFSPSELEKLQDDWIQSSEREATGGESAVRMLDQNRYFGAGIKRVKKQAPENSYSIVVFGRVRHSATREVTPVLMVLLFVGIGSGAIITGVRGKARRLDFTLIRGLPTGVMELDPKDIIVAANDRAQEIFDVKLPGFGIAKPGERPFGSLIADKIVVLDDTGQLPPGPVLTQDYNLLMLQRRNGHSSSYYALTRSSPQQLVRVSGSTFIGPTLQLHTFGTIDTFIDESHRDRVIAALASAASGADAEV